MSKEAIEFFANEETEVSEALEQWAAVALEKPTKRSDEALIDRLTYLLERSRKRKEREAEEARDFPEGLDNGPEAA